MTPGRVVVIGGGAAGCFAAAVCAEARPGTTVTVVEKGARLLSKVRVSGGGRCNVTHACFDAREFSESYPRGGQALIGPLHRFQARDTVSWFAAHGVELKAEADGRMFPITDSSQTVVDCLVRAASAAGVRFRTGSGVESLRPGKPRAGEVTASADSTDGESGGYDRETGASDNRLPLGTMNPNSELRAPSSGSWKVELTSGEALWADRVLVATGGCRSAAAGRLVTELGHGLEPPVPSLFTFQVGTTWLRRLAGVSVADAELSVPGTALRERGPLLVTHWGVSGPAVLRLSAWGARSLHGLGYRFPLRIHWLPGWNEDAIRDAVRGQRAPHPARLVVNGPIPPLPARLWEQLALAAGIPSRMRWAELPRSAERRLAQQLTQTELAVEGKSQHRDEFVTCGGVPLDEVNLKTMESRQCPGLHFAGEVLDIDGLTGGFNFQAAWTTGWIAGRAMAEGLDRGSGR